MADGDQREKEKVIARCKDLLASYKALDPEAQAEFVRLWKEENMDDVIVGVLDGSMPVDQAQRWIDTAFEGPGRGKGKT